MDDVAQALTHLRALAANATSLRAMQRALEAARHRLLFVPPARSQRTSPLGEVVTARLCQRARALARLGQVQARATTGGAGAGVGGRQRREQDVVEDAEHVEERQAQGQQSPGSSTGSMGQRQAQQQRRRRRRRQGMAARAVKLEGQQILAGGAASDA